MANPPPQGQGNAGAGNTSLLLPDTGLGGTDPFTTAAAGGSDMSGGFVGQPIDAPQNVIGDPFFDPVFGSEMLGGQQEGVPGQAPFVASPDATPQLTRSAAGDTTQEPQPTSAAGGPRPPQTQQQGPLGELAPTLKKLASMLTGGAKGPTAPTAPAAPTAAARLSNFLSGQPQQQQQQQRDQQAPQGTEGGGTRPGFEQSPTGQAPPPTPQDTRTAMAPRPPVSAAFPTTLSSLAQATPPTAPTDTGPTPPPAATAEQGAGPGAAPVQAAPGAAPGTATDPGVAAIAGDPQQALRNLIEGRAPPLQGAPQTPPPTGLSAPTQQHVAQSQLAGTDTRPTAGFSPVLAQERAGFAKELDDPNIALLTATMISTENEGDPMGPAEAAMNRAKYAGTSLAGMLTPAFYGPMRNPRKFRQRMEELRRNPQRLQKLVNAAKTAAQGTNLLAGATDQGSGHDKNANYRGGRVIRFREIYNDWGGGPGGHAGAAQFRHEQQQRVRAGGQTAMNETTGQAPPQPQRFNPAAPGDVGAGAGTLPQPAYMNTLERLNRQRNLNQGIPPQSDLLDWLIQQA